MPRMAAIRLLDRPAKAGADLQHGFILLDACERVKLLAK